MSQWLVDILGPISSTFGRNKGRTYICPARQNGAIWIVLFVEMTPGKPWVFIYPIQEKTEFLKAVLLHMKDVLDKGFKVRGYTGDADRGQKFAMDVMRKMIPIVTFTQADPSTDTPNHEGISKLDAVAKTLEHCMNATLVDCKMPPIEFYSALRTITLIWNSSGDAKGCVSPKSRIGEDDNLALIVSCPFGADALVLTSQDKKGFIRNGKIGRVTGFSANKMIVTVPGRFNDIVVVSARVFNGLLALDDMQALLRAIFQHK